MPLSPQAPDPPSDTASTVSAPALPDISAWLQDLYPFATRTLALGAESLSFLDEGAADSPPVLLLHGNPGWSFSFRKLIPLLREGCRVIAPDLVGFGLSSKPRDPRYHTLDRHICDLAALVETLGLENLTLVLHGWGGPIGTALALAQSHRVRRLVYTNSWASSPRGLARKLPLGLRLALRGGLGRLLDRVLRLSITAPLESGTGRAVPDLVIEGYKFPYAQGEPRAAVRCFWQMFRHPDLASARRLAQMQSRLAELTLPVDVVWGIKDNLLCDVAAYRLHDSFANARMPRFVENAGHFVAEDCPEDLADTILREHISGLKKLG